MIIPVKIATPDVEGRIFHDVQAGQSFWSIAIAYQITIRDLEVWNNLSRNTPLKTGQRLFIPSKNTEGYATPTPIGMVVLAAPDADGRIIHEVQPYQALSTISDAYHVPMDRILVLNGIQADWPLQIGQKLLINRGNVTPSPTLSNIQKLKPEADGRYYHTVQSGETLSWIAGLYEISLSDLMAWNGLNADAILGAYDFDQEDVHFQDVLRAELGADAASLAVALDHFDSGTAHSGWSPFISLAEAFAAQ